MNSDNMEHGAKKLQHGFPSRWSRVRSPSPAPEFNTPQPLAAALHETHKTAASAVTHHGPESVSHLFWSQVYKTDYCWFWIGYTAPSGYGHFSINGRPIVAHKYAYQEAHGAVPSGLELHHDCQTRNCVNPEHLIVARHSEHMRIHAQYRSLKGMAQ